MRPITIVSQSTKVSPQDLAALVRALQDQCDKHFSPAWGVYAKLSAIAADPAVPYDPKGQEVIRLLDHSDQAGALGYHTDLPSGVPEGFAFVLDTVNDGLPWQPTVSHELLEQLLDPWCSLCVPAKLPGAFGKDTGKVAVVALEDADPVEDDVYSIDGVPVSNFVLPAWFTAAGTRYDFLGKLHAPLTLTPGGYISYSTTLGSWKQITAKEAFSKTSFSRHARRRRWHAERRKRSRQGT